MAAKPSRDQLGGDAAHGIAHEGFEMLAKRQHAHHQQHGRKPSRQRRGSSHKPSRP